jgi:transposase InsO family protein
MVSRERHTTSGRTDTSRKELKDYQIFPEDLIVSSVREQFTSKIFKHFLKHNNIKDKPIPKSYSQLQGKVEAYNKIVKNEFLAVGDMAIPISINFVTNAWKLITAL